MGEQQFWKGKIWLLKVSQTSHMSKVEKKRNIPGSWESQTKDLELKKKKKTCLMGLREQFSAAGAYDMTLLWPK